MEMAKDVNFMLAKARQQWRVDVFRKGLPPAKTHAGRSSTGSSNLC